MSSRRENFFSPYNTFPYFTKETLRAGAERFKLPLSTFNDFINKSLKNGEIIYLKRGHYVTRLFYEAHKTETGYLFFLANVLLKPSYVSLEAALQYYGFFAEAINFTVTSVTNKLPRQFKNRTGLYVYRNITENLFTGLKIVKDKFEFVIALPHKAIFDYLYYHTHCFTKNVHSDLLEELRIDTDTLSPNEKKSLIILIKRFTSIQMHL